MCVQGYVHNDAGARHKHDGDGRQPRRRLLGRQAPHLGRSLPPGPTRLHQRVQRPKDGGEVDDRAPG